MSTNTSVTSRNAETRFRSAARNHEGESGGYLTPTNSSVGSLYNTDDESEEDLSDVLVGSSEEAAKDAARRADLLAQQVAAEQHKSSWCQKVTKCLTPWR